MWHLWDQIVARYPNFPDTGTLRLMRDLFLVYLENSSMSFSLSRPIIMSILFGFLLHCLSHLNHYLHNMLYIIFFGGVVEGGWERSNQTPIISGQTLRNNTFMLLVDGIVNILGLQVNFWIINLPSSFRSRCQSFYCLTLIVYSCYRINNIFVSPQHRSMWDKNMCHCSA